MKHSELLCKGILACILLLRIFGLSPLSTLRLVAHWHSRIRMPSGIVCSAFSIANRIRSDGGGSQVLYAAIALAVANRAGLGYHHRPFRGVEHVVGDGTDFAHKWNRVFDFQKLGRAPQDRVVFSIDSRGQSLRMLFCMRNGVSITSSKFRYLVDLEPSWLDDVRPQLRQIYTPERTSGEGPPQGCFITLHARRGDVTSANHPGRWVSGSELQGDFLALREFLNLPDSKAEIVTDESYQEVSDLDSNLFLKHQDSNPLQAFERLVNAEVLVTGRSSFSYVAALLNLNVVVYRDFWHPPMPGWLRLRAIHYELDSRAAIENFKAVD